MPIRRNWALDRDVQQAIHSEMKGNYALKGRRASKRASRIAAQKRARLLAADEHVKDRLQREQQFAARHALAQQRFGLDRQRLQEYMREGEATRKAAPFVYGIEGVRGITGWLDTHAENKFNKLNRASEEYGIYQMMAGMSEAQRKKFIEANKGANEIYLRFASE